MASTNGILSDETVILSEDNKSALNSFYEKFLDNPRLEWKDFNDELTLLLASSIPNELCYLKAEDIFNKYCQSLGGDYDMEAAVKFLNEAAKERPDLKMKLEPHLPKPHAFIKNLAIEIDNGYGFSNSPFSHQDEQGNISQRRGKGTKEDTEKIEEGFFIGRQRDLNKFGKLLDSSLKKGVFLVTGYRGMGKTSFVNFAIKKYKKNELNKNKIVKVINLNLAQKDPTESDILKLMVSHLYEHMCSWQEMHGMKWGVILKRCLLISIVLLPLFLSINYWTYLTTILDKTGVEQPSVGFFVEKAGETDELYKLNEENYSWPYITNKDKDTYRFFPGQLTFTLSQDSGLINSSSKLLNSQTEVDRSIWIRVFQVLIWLDFVAILTTFLVMMYRSMKPKYQNQNSPFFIIDSIFKRCYSVNSIERGMQQEISVESIGTRFSGSFEKETMNFPVASSKEIEYDLERFLKEAYSKINTEFIFVFDELDKIEPAAVTANYLNDEGKFGEQQSNTYLQQIRQRKQSVINIIAGLKNFLTTAQARFVFIAGREMFDATLADVADRQSSISSIFNYVFYIESFLKENLNQDNIKSSLSSSIENYLIYVIFGKENAEKMEASLFDLLFKKYQEDLVPFDKEITALTEKNNKTEIELVKYRRLVRNRLKMKHGYWKSLILLQNFIIYLTYRSNGSPKKIIKLVQEFIRLEEGFKLNRASCFLIGKPYLDEDRTPRAYLFFGFDDQYRIGFINHLYRPFLIRYGQSFNKYSDNIILSTTYLLDHLLKFHPFAFSLPNLELTPEVLSTNKTPLLREHILTIIDYLSNNHLRETEIGIFDYKFYSRTQNELIYISKTFEAESAAFNFTLDEGYLIKLHIRDELKRLREIHSKSNRQDISSMSISHLNGILGDLHFFDQEYDDAIVAYSDCIQLIGKPNDNLENFIRSQRFKLKLGLTLEKVKSYDEAVAFYADATQESLSFFSTYRYEIKKDTVPMLNDVLQIANQAFLALIVLQEKMGIDGISLKNILNSLNNLNKVSSQVLGNGKTNRLVDANMYLVSGNLLYFKNGDDLNELPINNRKFTPAINKLAKGIEHVCSIKQHSSLAFYYQGLLALLQKHSDTNFSNPGINIMHPLFVSDHLKNALGNTGIAKNELKYIAIFLSHIGDCMFSTIKHSDDGEPNYHSLKVEDIFENPSRGLGFLSDVATSKSESVGIADVLRCYYWSALFFGKRGRAVSNSFQLRKILYVLHIVFKDVHNERNQEKVNRNKEVLNIVEQQILRPILDIASTTAEHSDYHMITKFRNSKFYTEEKDGQLALDVFLNNNISNHPDTREAMSLFLYIRLKLSSEDLSTEYIRYRKFITPDNSFATQYTRIYELNFWSKLNLLRFLEIKLTWKANSHLKENDKKEQFKGIYMYAFEYLHAQFSSLLMMDIYGADYAISHSLKGFIHYNVGEFIRDWPCNDLRKDEIPIEDLIKFISLHIGFNPLGSMGDPAYHFAMAISYFEKAKQLHSQGQEYRRNMDNLIYLEDDINDNAYHFGAAVDRYLISNMTFNEFIKKSELQLYKLKYKGGKVSERHF